jgi:integrase
VSDVDLRHRTIRINKAWKRNGEDGEKDIPGWLNKQLQDKHTMRGHHLGNPKTPKSKRTIEISREVAAILRTRIADKAQDDFVFVTPTGLPLHNADFYERVWTPLTAAIKKLGVAPFRFHDLRHTHVSWPHRRRRPAAPHPGPARPRVDHDHHRHVWASAARRQRPDRTDHRHRSAR